MTSNDKNTDVFQTSPLLILLSYSVLVGALIAETILMSWELWAIPLLITAVVVCWAVHISGFSNSRVRIWIYTLFMMVTVFFYGIHVTSAYDMGLVMMIIIMIFTTTGEIGVIYVCMFTYFFTLIYDIVVMTINGYVWDSLTISRTILHVGLLLLACFLARTIIRRWSLIFGKTGDRITELNESTKRMNSFMANLSHELRTPINAILGITNVMLDKEHDKELRSNMNEVLDAGNRLADQVGDILDYSEIEMDSLVVNSDNYMISSVLNDLVSELRPIMPDNLELIIDVDAEIPSILRGDPIKLRWIMYHLISNGLKYTKDGGVYVKLNAIKHDYGINLCIEVTDTGVGMTKDELDRIYNRFYQAESGREIRSGGLGISMVIVSGFVRALNGFMTIYSEKDAGTTVRVSIPQEIVDEGRCMVVENKISLGAYLDFSKYANPNVREFYNKMVLSIVTGLRTTMHRVDNEEDLKKLLERVDLTHLFVADEEYERSSAYLESISSKINVIVVARDSFELPEGSGCQIMRKPFYCIPVVAVLNSDRAHSNTPEIRLRCDGIKALVVDDEPMNLSVARGIFRRYGMEVKTADSGEQSIEMCKKEDFDIVFMDHMMPGMDGVQAMKRIRYEGTRGSNMVIVALTANALSSAREMFIAEGFDGFVSKPIELLELERVLKHVLPKSAISYETADGQKIEIEQEAPRKAEKETAEEAAPEKTEETAFEEIEEPAIEKEETVAESITDAVEEIVEIKTEGETLKNVSEVFEEISNKSAPVEIDITEELKGEKPASADVMEEAGINKSLVISYCGEDEELYGTVLKQYVSDYEDHKGKLSKFLSEKDMKNYAIVVHGLKSTSLMIGAEELSAKAKALELSAKENNIEFVESNHDDLIENYDKVISALKDAGYSADEEDDEIMEFYPEEGQ